MAAQAYNHRCNLTSIPLGAKVLRCNTLNNELTDHRVYPDDAWQGSFRVNLSGKRIEQD
jgi:hypothetical protein